MLGLMLGIVVGGMAGMEVNLDVRRNLDA